MEIAHNAAHSADLALELWEEHRDRVYRYLLRLTGESGTAEDLTQETFLQVIRDLRRSSKPAEYAAAWLMRIATNRAMDLFRRRRLIKWLPFRPERHDQTISDTADSVAERDLVETALRQLPPEAAAILLLRDAEGFSVLEIAAMLALDPSTVRKRISRARHRFREAYPHLRGGTR